MWKFSCKDAKRSMIYMLFLMDVLLSGNVSRIKILSSVYFCSFYAAPVVGRLPGCSFFHLFYSANLLQSKLYQIWKPKCLHKCNENKSCAITYESHKMINSYSTLAQAVLPSEALHLLELHLCTSLHCSACETPVS